MRAKEDEILTDRPGVAVLDWDGTLRHGFTLVDWSEWLALETGLISSGSLQRLRELFSAYASDEMSYESLALEGPRAYAIGLRGVAVRALELAATRFVEQDSGLAPFATPFFSLLRDHALGTVLVSGAPAVLLRRYPITAGVDEVIGLELRTQGGRCTGRLGRNPAPRRAKRAIVRRLERDSQLVLGVGDSPADAPILERAQIAVAIHLEGDRPHHPPVNRVGRSQLLSVTERNVLAVVGSTLQRWSGTREVS